LLNTAWHAWEGQSARSERVVGVGGPLAGFSTPVLFVLPGVQARSSCGVDGGSGLGGAAARRWEPKRLRLRLFAVAGRLVRTGRRARLNLARTWRWTGPRLSSTPPMPCRH